MQIGTATGIKQAHIEAIHAITSNENFKPFYKDLKKEYAAFNNQSPPHPQPMKYAIARLRTLPQYQELIDLAYAKMSQITGRPDPANDVEIIMTLIEKGKGVHPNQIGKDVAFYSGRTWLVLFMLPWKITSFFTGVRSVSVCVVHVSVRTRGRLACLWCASCVALFMGTFIVAK